MGQVYTLDVRVVGRRVRARIGKGRELPSVFSLDAGVSVTKGMPGVLVVAEPPMGRSALAVSRYELAGRTGVATPIRPTYLLTGTPMVSKSGITVQVRVGAERACQVVIQHASDPGFGSSLGETAPVTVTAPSYTTKTSIPVGASVWWRAVLTDPRSGAHRTTRAQHVMPPDPGEPLVMGAASCAQLWNAKGYHGLTRFVNEAAPVRAAMLVYQGDFGYPSNSVNSCLRAEPDFYVDRITRFLRSPDFINLRAAMPVGFTMDDHEYGPQNNSDRTTLYPWTVDLWNSHARRSVRPWLLRLAFRRRALPDTRWPPLLRSGQPAGVAVQDQARRHAEAVAAPDPRDHDAQLVVIFSADIFATRGKYVPQIDCWWYGWTTEYAELMTLFHDTQRAGKRVVILSGDAHGQRIHRHPDPARRTGTATVVEFICSGLRARTWSMEHRRDPTIDPARRVAGASGLGMIIIDPAGAPARSITLRSINGDDGSLDLFPPLTIPFSPADDGSKPPTALKTPTHHPNVVANDQLQ